MGRKEDLEELFSNTDANVKLIVMPMIDQLIFIEEQLEELRKEPHIRYSPKDRSLQKETVAGKRYDKLLMKHADLTRFLVSCIRKNGDEGSVSPLREWVKKAGK